jgi:hypothetical protein
MVATSPQPDITCTCGHPRDSRGYPGDDADSGRCARCDCAGNSAARIRGIRSRSATSGRQPGHTASGRLAGHTPARRRAGNVATRNRARCGQPRHTGNPGGAALDASDDGSPGTRRLSVDGSYLARGLVQRSVRRPRSGRWARLQMRVNVVVQFGRRGHESNV